MRVLSETPPEGGEVDGQDERQTHSDQQALPSKLKIWESSPFEATGANCSRGYIEGEGWRIKLNAAITTSAHVIDAADATDIFEGLIHHPKVTAWVAQPGAGKTAIAVEAAARIATQRYEVLYFQADAGLADLKHYVSHAEENGYQLLSNLNVSDQVLAEVVEGLAEGDLGEGRDLSNVVVFIDTLKKFCNVINKDSKEFYKLVRAISVRGGSVVLLGHCNKHKDSDGKLVYEGTGDLKADIDVLTYWYDIDEGDFKRVSSQHDKQRALLSDQTFMIDKRTREVRLVEFENIQERLSKQIQEEVDEELVSFIQGRIRQTPMTQKDIVATVSNNGLGGRNSVLNLLSRYEGVHWARQKVPGSNASKYVPLEKVPPKQTTKQTEQTNQIRPSFSPY